MPPRPVLPNVAEARRRSLEEGVEAAWQSLTGAWRWREEKHRALWPGQPFPSVVALLEAAAAEPRLRRLQPYTSHEALNFSSSVSFPWVRQAGVVVPLYNGRFQVHRCRRTVLVAEVATPEEAVAVVVTLLPEHEPPLTLTGGQGSVSGPPAYRD